jgi:hypothetical protein
MKSFLLLSFSIFLLVLTSCEFNKTWDLTLRGTIGKDLSSRIRLAKKGETFEGDFVYTRDSTKSIFVKGTQEGDILRLEEFDEYHERVTGVFEGTFDGKDYQGFWLSPDGKDKVPFSYVLQPGKQFSKRKGNEQNQRQNNLGNCTKIFVSISGRQCSRCAIKEIKKEIYLVGMIDGEEDHIDGVEDQILVYMKQGTSWKKIYDESFGVESYVFRKNYDLELVTTKQDDWYVFFSRTRQYHGSVHAYGAEAEFFLIEVGTKKYFSEYFEGLLNYDEENDISRVEYDMNSLSGKTLGSNPPNIQRILIQKAKESPLIYQLQPEDLDINHPKNHIEKWEERFNGLKSSPTPLNVTYYDDSDREWLIGDGEWDEIIENDGYIVYSGFHSPVIGYEKAKKKYFVIYVPSGFYIGGMWGGRSVYARWRNKNNNLIKLENGIECDFDLERKLFFP